MGRFIDLTGQKFGRLTVLKQAENHITKGGNVLVQWLCVCDCGKKIKIPSISLRSGRTQSCGCLHKEVACKLATNAFTKHDKSKTKIYKTWINIKTRCTNEHTQRSKDYINRGITICNRWLNSFEAFYEDVSKLPHFEEKGYSINRIDNDGDYEPNNVEWADDIKQANNKRNNHYITHNGKTQTLSQWARETEIKRSTLAMRIEKYGWSIEKALTTK